MGSGSFRSPLACLLLCCSVVFALPTLYMYSSHVAVVLTSLLGYACSYIVHVHCTCQSVVKNISNEVIVFPSQQQLNQIKAWREQVSSMTKSFCTENGIFYVDCRDLQVLILPLLNNNFRQLVQMVVLDVIRLSDEEVKDVDKLSQVHVH